MCDPLGILSYTPLIQASLHTPSSAQRLPQRRRGNREAPARRAVDASACQPRHRRQHAHTDASKRSAQRSSQSRSAPALQAQRSRDRRAALQTSRLLYRTLPPPPSPHAALRSHGRDLDPPRPPTAQPGGRVPGPKSKVYLCGPQMGSQSPIPGLGARPPRPRREADLSPEPRPCSTTCSVDVCRQVHVSFDSASPGRTLQYGISPSTMSG
ncbi:hypothetical protein OH77DRAFT_105237 [Trametes cingulata]|nr:hypothetical protein OH77DRAFT_105237 [Trametes cingulata]